MRRPIFTAAALLFTAVVVQAQPAEETAYPHLLMGNPSGAKDDPETPDNYLLKKPHFAVSYNDARGGPNWSSWCLRADDIGDTVRSNPFAPDQTLPKGFRRIRPAEYNGSGFDRGHLCPNGDRDATKEAAATTFVMSNMLPQAPNLNQKAWADLEVYCRSLVKRKGMTLYIVAGGAGKGGEGSKGEKETISSERVTVPAKLWKVVLCVEKGDGTAADIDRVGPATRVIAVVMPNDQSVGHGWGKHRVSVKEVEALTGYTFFSAVPDDVMKPLKARVDDGPTR